MLAHQQKMWYTILIMAVFSTTNWQDLTGMALLEALEKTCIANGVSDIHLSPAKDKARVEVRLHGMLEEVCTTSLQSYEDIVRSIKFKSKLLLNITSRPQDGQYTISDGLTEVKVRVASIPSRFGETYTLRLLDPRRGIVPLENLGFPPEITTKLKETVELPNGLFLVTGPTGSGKTTTLYALLKTLVGTKRNIITLEDPIEYELPGIVQSQINAEENYTFSSGLRSILRHDPDVILLGEIRDFETAQTAIDAALTGHMVLATLHTNSAAEAIPRLLSMGVSPYTFAPSLRAILAQRLVRTLKNEYQVPNAQYDPADSTAYDGRMSLPELLLISDEIRQLIFANETADAIVEKAQTLGYRTMTAWGGLLLNAHRTSRAEIDRVLL